MAIDSPFLRWAGGKLAECSPRTRGWSSPCARCTRQEGVLPSYAGMVPSGDRRGCRVGVLPRARTERRWISPYLAGTDDKPVRGAQ